MHATPERPPTPGKKPDKKAEKAVSRAKKYEGERTEDYEPPELKLPEVDPCEHLVDYLFEVGPTTGEHALSWQELNAWCDRTGVELDEFEATTIISLSKAYLGMLHEGREWDCPPPYRFVEDRAAKRARIAQAMRERMQTVREEMPTNKGLRKRDNADS